MLKDIVCGMGIEKDDPKTLSRMFNGSIYYFCSPECMMLFSKNPDDYLHPEMKRTNFVRDLVCGMDVDKDNPPFISVWKEITYYFCSNVCKSEFERSPEKFIKKEQSQS